MASQFFAVKGQRPKWNYTDAINAQTPYLPQQYAYGKEREMADKEYQMNKDYLNEANELAKKGLKQQKKDARYANIIGAGTLGVDTYFAAEAAKKAPKTSAANVVNNIDAKSMLTKPGSTEISTIDKAKDWLAPNKVGPEGITSGLTTQNLIGSGTAGMVAGGLLGKKKKLNSALWGGVAGGAASYLASGGDLYKSALGLVSGAGGGLLSKWF